jgi:hypothetical protein
VRQRVYLALSREGIDRVIGAEGSVPSPIWVSFGVFSSAELSVLRESGVDITDFLVRIDPANRQQLAQAIYTVRQHHAGRVIVVGNDSTP